MVRWRVSAMVLALVLGSMPPPARAQQAPITCSPSGGVSDCSVGGSARTQLRAATFIAGSEPTGDILAQAVALEVATAPFGSSSGGFTFTFNPALRSWRRTAGTFGPAFAERALTIGQNKLSAGFNFLHRTYDRFGELELASFDVFTFRGGVLPVSSSRMELETTTTTVAGFAHYGVLDNLDVGLLVPYVRLSISGTSRIFDQTGGELQRLALSSTESGLGDIAVFGKYRFKSFGADPAIEAGNNGALALAVTVRLPTGDDDGLRGLGVGRSLFSLVSSGTLGRFSPHANIGYELWTGSVTVTRDFQGLSTLSAKDQIHYAGGTEFELHPRLTLLGDVIGRYGRGAGQVGYQPYLFPPNQSRVEGAEALAAIPDGVHSAFLVPGVKWNFRRNGLVSANLLVSVTRQGLRDRVTPVIGLDWGF